MRYFKVFGEITFLSVTETTLHLLSHKKLLM